MELLINKNIVAKYLNVAIGCNDNDFNAYIEEAQEFDLLPLLGEELYNALLSNVNTPSWDILINGGVYSFEKKEYRHSGIKKVLSYFTYARYILKSNIQDSSFGFVQKKTPHSEPLSLEERRNFYYKYREDANTLMDRVKSYINRTELFKDFCNISRKTQSKNFSTRVIQ